MRPTAALLFLLGALSFTLSSQNRVLDSIENLVRTAPNQQQATIEKATLVFRCYAAGQTEKCERLRQEVWNEAETLVSDSVFGAAYNMQGILYYYQGKFDSAVPYFERGLEYRRKAKDYPGVLRTLSNLGGIFYMEREREKALKYYEDALRLEADQGFKEGEFVSINNLGAIYLEMNINPKALRYFHIARRKYEADNSSGNLSMSYDGLSKVHENLDNIDSAIHYVHKSIKSSIDDGDMSGYAYAKLNLGIIYHKQKKYDSAVATLREIVPMAIKLGDGRLLTGAYGNIAANFVESGQIDSALVYAELLLPLQQQVQDKTLSEDLAKLFGELYYRKGDYKSAYENIKLYSMIKDSLYNVNMNAKLAEMQEKYDSEKKERDNQMLQAENKQVRATRNYLTVILAIALISIVGGVFAYTKIRRAHHTIRSQKELVEVKQKEIMDSINYAKRIQYALLASQQLLKKYLPEHFVFFKPKDVVSGDFYWASPTEDGFAIVAGDCTGHGVPGAFMSLLNITKLGQVINEQKITRPDLVLNKVRSEIIRSLNPEDRAEETRDGMDAIICKFRLDTLQLEYAAANNSFYIVRHKKIMPCKADKMPVGKGHDDDQPFTFNSVQLEKGDVVYLFTDGFADQFGGPLGKKYKYKQLEQLLTTISTDPIEKQKLRIEDEFERWRGALEQVDDVCVIGVRV